MSDIEGNRLYAKCLGCLAGGIIGDALGAPSEGKSPAEIEQQFGWLDDFESGGTDDTMRAGSPASSGPRRCCARSPRDGPRRRSGYRSRRCRGGPPRWRCRSPSPSGRRLYRLSRRPTATNRSPFQTTASSRALSRARCQRFPSLLYTMADSSLSPPTATNRGAIAQTVPGCGVARLLPCPSPLSAVHDRATLADCDEAVTTPRDFQERVRGCAVAGRRPAIPIAAVHDRAIPTDRDEAVATTGDAVETTPHPCRPPATPVGAMHDLAVCHRHEAPRTPGDVLEPPGRVAARLHPVVAIVARQRVRERPPVVPRGDVKPPPRRTKAHATLPSSPGSESASCCFSDGEPATGTETAISRPTMPIPTPPRSGLILVTAGYGNSGLRAILLACRR